MSKLKLQLDALQVETFQVAPDGPGAIGTVLGHVKPPVDQPASIEPCVPYSHTCGASCNGSCVATCQASCFDTCAAHYTCAQSCSVLARCFPPAGPA